jgi:antitoxin HicB
MSTVKEKNRTKGPRETSKGNLKFRIILEPYEDEKGSYFVAICPTLPGCVTQGDTREEAVENIKDAIEGYLLSLKKHGDPIPPPISEEVIEVKV